MRIGVNALYLIPGGVGGTEIYLRSLLAAAARIDSENEYVVFTNAETGADLAPDAPNFRIAPQPVRAANRPGRILWEQFALPVCVARARLDVLLNPGFTAPVAAPCRQVTVFHDLQHKRHPEFFSASDLAAWRLLLFLSACVSDRLICVSEATRSDLLRYYPVPAERVAVVPHGVDSLLFSLRREPSQFLLCVSTLHPHKNLERLLRVFARFRASHPEWRLVLAGMRGFHAEAIDRTILELGLSEVVRVTGWIPREELYELYRTAGGFVYPSTFEGFGMPVSEALAAGVPTACSDIEPLRSVAGGAAILFPPHDDDAMLAALERLISEPPSGGREQAAKFSWEAAAAATLEQLRG